MEFFDILRKNDTQRMEKFISESAVNKEIQGQTLLYWTVHAGNLEMAKILIDHGALLNKKDRLGRTPLSAAAYFGFVDIAKLLLKKNAKIDTQCMDRAYFGWDGHVQTEILALFRNYGWINVYLDDLRDIPDSFVGARNIEEAIKLIKNNNVHLLSLDHDLGVDDKGNLLPTGYDFVKYICKNGLRPANKIYIHTDNVVGRENMYQTLLAARKRGFIDDDIEIYHYPITNNFYSG
jgi:ankyrin repeat protein